MNVGDLANPACPVCLHRFQRGDDVIQIIRTVPSSVVYLDGRVERFTQTVAVTYCAAHAPP